MGFEGQIWIKVGWCLIKGHCILRILVNSTCYLLGSPVLSWSNPWLCFQSLIYIKVLRLDLPESHSPRHSKMFGMKKMKSRLFAQKYWKIMNNPSSFSQYPLVIWHSYGRWPVDIDSSMIYLLKMMSFHSEVRNYQRIWPFGPCFRWLNHH